MGSATQNSINYDTLKRAGNCGSEGQSVVLKEYLRLVETFLIDKITGNITLNIKDGRILGLRAERLYDLKIPASR